ncbi:MAG: hypothetical protein ACYCOU_05910 [Sulfobacillus sp.]
MLCFTPVKTRLDAIGMDQHIFQYPVFILMCRSRGAYHFRKISDNYRVRVRVRVRVRLGDAFSCHWLINKMFAKSWRSSLSSSSGFHRHLSEKARVFLRRG